MYTTTLVLDTFDGRRLIPAGTLVEINDTRDPSQARVSGGAWFRVKAERLSIDDLAIDGELVVPDGQS